MARSRNSNSVSRTWFPCGLPFLPSALHWLVSFSGGFFFCRVPLSNSRIMTRSVATLVERNLSFFKIEKKKKARADPHWTDLNHMSFLNQSL